jgi:hypothetical protein
MSDSGPAGHKDVAKVLEGAGYEVHERLLAERQACIAATPYAVVACVELEDFDRLEEYVSDVQAELTQLASEAPSARSWDLYLVVLLAQLAQDSEQRSLIEAIEGDTAYTRKFVYTGLAVDGLDQALRPLLPLRPVAQLEIEDPLEELRIELLAIGVEKPTVEEAISSFENGDEVILR